MHRSLIIERGIERELVFQTSRSSGPGGQHVNKTESRVELRFHVQDSAVLSEEEKLTITNKLKNRINAEGWLQIVVQESRSQLMNRELAIEKLVEIIDKALYKAPVRRATRPTRSSVIKRGVSKQKASSLKQSRSKPSVED